MIKKRIESIDFLRTIAILIMLIANAAPYTLKGPHPIWFRMICSFAAPLFIFISGFSFFLSFKKNQNYKHKLVLTLYLLLSAIFVDVVIWGILPFQTFDVLYLIAFGQAINILIFRLKFPIKLFIALIFIVSSPLLENYFGYRFNNKDFNLNSVFSSDFNLSGVFQFSRFCIDGWFPLTPWIGFAIIGSVSAELSEKISLNLKTVKWVSLIFLIGGLGVFFSQNVIQREREGYLELFYPPTPLFLLIAFAFIFTTYSFSIKMNFYLHSRFNYINILGRHSLFIYIFHAFIVSYVFQSYLVPSGCLQFVFLMVAFVSICILLTTLLERINKKDSLKSIPLFIKTILGLK